MTPTLANVLQPLIDVFGQVLVFFVLVVAAAEVVVGLAIITLMFRHRETVNVEAFSTLPGRGVLDVARMR